MHYAIFKKKHKKKFDHDKNTLLATVVIDI